MDIVTLLVQVFPSQLSSVILELCSSNNGSRHNFLCKPRCRV